MLVVYYAQDSGVYTLLLVVIVSIIHIVNINAELADAVLLQVREKVNQAGLWTDLKQTECADL